jgi:hypothetical protein
MHESYQWSNFGAFMWVAVHATDMANDRPAVWNGPDLDNPVAVAKYIGRQYVESDRLRGENSSYISVAYENLGRIVAELFRQIPIPVLFQESDPYDDYQDMARTVEKEQKLRVYALHTSHPEFSHTEQLMFRAVHDWFGHLEADVDFTPEGEFKKWQHMNQYLENKRQELVMFAEVVGQVGMVHYLQDGFESDRYEQRAFAAPDRWIHFMQRAVEQ